MTSEAARYFTMGAGAAHAKVVALLMAKGHMPLAIEIMSMKLPEPREPDTFEVKG